MTLRWRSRAVPPPRRSSIRSSAVWSPHTACSARSAGWTRLRSTSYSSVRYSFAGGSASPSPGLRRRQDVTRRGSRSRHQPVAERRGAPTNPETLSRQAGWLSGRRRFEQRRDLVAVAGVAGCHAGCQFTGAETLVLDRHRDAERQGCDEAPGGGVHVVVGGEASDAETKRRPGEAWLNADGGEDVGG